MPASPIPTGADDVVLKLSYEGGFVPAGVRLRQHPALLVSGDGRVFTPGCSPGDLPRSAAADRARAHASARTGIQQLLGIVEDAGLLPSSARLHRRRQRRRRPEHRPDDQRRRRHVRAQRLCARHRDPREPCSTEVARRDDRAQRHRAGRRRSQPRPDEPFVPTSYRFQARVVDPTRALDPRPRSDRSSTGPRRATMSLADATECARARRRGGRLAVHRCQAEHLLQRRRRRVSSWPSQACCREIPPADAEACYFREWGAS